MEGKVNYLYVGIFVALFITGILSFAFWLMKYNSYEKPNHYVVYFDESIAGLSKDASVKYMGVDAGIVENIKVHSTNTQLVAVYLKLNHDIKIKEDMRATLKFYGMTGLAYVEIFGTDTNSTLLTAKEGEIPVIKSSPSLFVRLDEIIIDLSTKFSVALSKINTLLSENNIQHVESSLENINAITKELNTNKSDITSLIKETSNTMIEIEKTFYKINQMTGQLNSTFGTDLQAMMQEFKYTSSSIKKLTRNIDKSLKRGDYNLKEVSEPMMQKLSIMIEEINTLSIKIEDTVEQIQESPSDLLFKSKAVKLGPGEQ